MIWQVIGLQEIEELYEMEMVILLGLTYMEMGLMQYNLYIMKENCLILTLELLVKWLKA